MYSHIAAAAPLAKETHLENCEASIQKLKERADKHAEDHVAQAAVDSVDQKNQKNWIHLSCSLNSLKGGLYRGVLCLEFCVSGSACRAQRVRFGIYGCVAPKGGGLGLGYVGIPKYPIIGYLGLGL